MKPGSIASFRAAAEQPDREDDEPRRGGPACGRCGRYVAHRTIRWTPQDDVDQGAPEATGVCGIHGRVEVNVS